MMQIKTWQIVVFSLAVCAIVLVARPFAFTLPSVNVVNSRMKGEEVELTICLVNNGISPVYYRVDHEKVPLGVIRADSSPKYLIEENYKYAKWRKLHGEKVVFSKVIFKHEKFGVALYDDTTMQSKRTYWVDY